MGRIRNFEKLKFRPFSKRIGNIEMKNFYVDNKGKKKPMQSHLTKKFDFFEIVRWQANTYFGKQHEFEQTPGGCYRKGTLLLEESYFKQPEYCYVLAHFVNLDDDEVSPELQFCGGRPFDLSDEERDQFWEVAKAGYDNISKQIQKFIEKQGE